MLASPRLPIKSRLDRGREFVLNGSLGDDVGETTFRTFDKHGSPVRAASSSSHGRDHVRTFLRGY